MRKLLLLLVGILLSITSEARQLSVDEAFARLSGVNKSLSIFKHNRTISDDDHNLLYILDGATQRLIVSADDCAPALLGTLDISDFSVDSLPSNVQYWVDHYASLISAAIEKGVTLSVLKSASATNIEPLLSSMWDQSAPYNNNCIQFGGTPSVTGCVATAMAQIMYYYKYPLKGIGSHSYSYKIYDLEGTLITVEPSADFGATTYEWDKMLDHYSGASVSIPARAVATLMYHCGVSVDMTYAGSESSANSNNVAHALMTYFGYDKGMSRNHASSFLIVSG